MAARGGDDVWLELRKKPDPAAAAASEESAPSVAERAPSRRLRRACRGACAERRGPYQLPRPSRCEATAAASIAPISEDAEEPPPFEIVHEVQQAAPSDADVNALLAASASALESASVREMSDIAVDAHEHEEVHVETVSEPVAMSVAEPDHAASIEATLVVASDPAATASVVTDAAPTVLADATPMDEDALEDEPERERAVVVPLARQAIRSETTVSSASPRVEGFSVAELLRVAAARGASTVYVVAQSQPMIRADGEIIVLDIGSGAPLADSDVNRLVLDLAPPAARDAWQRGASAEWMCDVEDVGRVRWRCLTFREHRGPGLIFRMIPPRAISADQLGLTPEVQALCSQSEGLVLVAGPRASGKSTLMSAFIDLINRTRSDHVVTIESQISFVHESRRSFVSQREVRGDSDAVVAAVRAALREDPDVLLIEDLRSAEIAAVALEAADSGRLVFGSLPAPSTVAAIDRLLELFAPDRRAQAQSSLAGTLRGVVAQVLLRRARGGRLAAREVLLNTPPVAALIEEGKVVQLPLAMESGRRHGMIPLNDALAALVRDGTVHVTEAYLKAFDKEGLLTALKREGIDTSFAERLA